MDADLGHAGPGSGEPPDGLLSAMEERALAERESVLAEARTAARAIAERAEREVERRRAEALRRLDRELRGEAQRALGEARMEARAARLRLKRELLAEAYRRARERLSRLAGADPDCYASAFEALLTEAVASSRGGGDAPAVAGPSGVEVRTGDARACAASLGRAGLESPAREIGDEPLTLVVISRDGASRTDNSLWSRLARMESREAEVARILFGPGDTRS